MFATVQAPVTTSVLVDDPAMPGRYLTDGERLFRVVGGGAPRRGHVALEDCASLEVWLVESGELGDLDVVAARRQSAGLAA